jgi:hypothetical protein
VSHYKVIRVSFHARMGTRIVILQILLNMQDFYAIRDVFEEVHFVLLSLILIFIKNISKV